MLGFVFFFCVFVFFAILKTCITYKHPIKSWWCTQCVQIAVWFLQAHNPSNSHVLPSSMRRIKKSHISNLTFYFPIGGMRLKMNVLKMSPISSNPWQTSEASGTFHICFHNLHHCFSAGRRKWVPLNGSVFVASEDSKLSALCNRLHVNKPAALATSTSEWIFWLKTRWNQTVTSSGRSEEPTHLSLKHSATSVIYTESQEVAHSETLRQ